MDAEIHLLVKHGKIVVYDDWFCNTKGLFFDLSLKDEFIYDKSVIIDILNRISKSEYLEFDNFEILNKMLSIMNTFHSVTFTFLLHCCVR